MGSIGSVSQNCEPLAAVPQNPPVLVGNLTQVDSDAVYYPCGLIANSMFSDEISQLTCVDSVFGGKPCNNNDSQNIVQYTFNLDNIAWPGDKGRYVKSQWTSFDPEALPRKVVPPPYWRQAFPKWKDGYTAENFPDISTMYRLQVWMRTAGLPTFRKLWGSNTDNLLPKGVWQVDINMSINSII